MSRTFGPVILMLVLASAPATAGKAPPASPWTGNWVSEGHHLSIGVPASGANGRASQIGFQFTLEGPGECGNVSCPTFEGTAVLIADGEAVGSLEGVASCSVTLWLSPAQLQVVAIGCDDLSGGVPLSGTYASAPLAAEPTSVGSETRFSKTQQAAFDRMTGSAASDFNDWLAVSGADDRDLDGFGAKVWSGCKAHECDAYGAIVMLAPDGRMWAATADTAHATIRYFTNVPGWGGKLPTTISTWAGEWSGCGTVFESADSDGANATTKDCGIELAGITRAAEQAPTSWVASSLFGHEQLEGCVLSVRDPTWARGTLVPDAQQTDNATAAFRKRAGVWELVDLGTAGVGCGAPPKAASDLGFRCLE